MVLHSNNNCYYVTLLQHLLIPRIQAGGRVTDLNTNRCRYSIPYVVGDWIGWVTQVCKRVIHSIGPQTDMSKVLRKIGELNMHRKTSAFSKFGCKNEGFMTAMVLRGAELHRDSFLAVYYSSLLSVGVLFLVYEKVIFNF